MAKTDTPDKAAYMKAGTPSEAAKILGHTDGGKKFRARLRNLAGKAVDNPERFNREAKEQLWEAFVEGKAIAKAEATKETKATSKKSTKVSA